MTAWKCRECAVTCTASTPDRYPEIYRCECGSGYQVHSNGDLHHFEWSSKPAPARPAAYPMKNEPMTRLLPPPPPPPLKALAGAPVPPPPPPAKQDALTDWFPMRVAPAREGNYKVKHEDLRNKREYETREFWDGKRWPGLVGKFSAIAWCGLALEPKQ